MNKLQIERKIKTIAFLLIEAAKFLAESQILKVLECTEKIKEELIVLRKECTDEALAALTKIDQELGQIDQELREQYKLNA